MEGKLKKIGNEYKLYAQDDSCIATSWQSPYQRLSKKNCEAIENGYDLDELSLSYVSDHLTKGTDEYHNSQIDFKEGFQKALEILGDKKYNEYVKFMFQFGFNLDNPMSRNEYDAHIQSLQQTEWDVEIDMICPHPIDTYRCGLQYGCDGDGCNHPNQIPYLDKEGCLILKSK